MPLTFLTFFHLPLHTLPSPSTPFPLHPPLTFTFLYLTLHNLPSSPSPHPPHLPLPHPPHPPLFTLPLPSSHPPPHPPLSLPSSPSSISPSSWYLEQSLLVSRLCENNTTVCRAGTRNVFTKYGLFVSNNSLNGRWEGQCGRGHVGGVTGGSCGMGT